MIHEMLAEGRENAITGRALADALQCDIRSVTIQIEQERRQGHPICAATGNAPGYYLARDADELQCYCDIIEGRATELFKTRQALIKVLRQYADGK